MPAKTVSLPNIRKLFLPDPGYTFLACDLDRADLQVVVWEAGEGELKWALANGVDIHLLSAQVIFNLPYTLDDLLLPKEVKVLKKKYKAQRNGAKHFVHATNYGASARTAAAACQRVSGIPVSEYMGKAAQDRWFTRYPGIKKWHQRVENELYTSRHVRNRFNFRRDYFGRIEGLLPEALSWVPQSTVALVIDAGMLNIEEQFSSVDVFNSLQIHDEVVLQVRTSKLRQLAMPIRDALHITIPYDDPLVIPIGPKVSNESWGACVESTWEELAA